MVDLASPRFREAIPGDEELRRNRLEELGEGINHSVKLLVPAGQKKKAKRKKKMQGRRRRERARGSGLIVEVPGGGAPVAANSGEASCGRRVREGLQENVLFSGTRGGRRERWLVGS